MSQLFDPDEDALTRIEVKIDAGVGEANAVLARQLLFFEMYDVSISTTLREALQVLRRSRRAAECARAPADEASS